MAKTKKSLEETPSKPAPVFPAPEWTGVASSLAAALAHEIRNPLLSIRGAAQLLEQAVGDEDKSLARLIIAESQRIEQLVATMDPLTPNPSQVLESLNIHEVTEYVRLAARSFAGGVRIATHYDPSLPEIRGHREALIQALMNLVKNAVEAVTSDRENASLLALQDRGLVTITTRYLLGEHMQRPDGARLTIQLSVTDNGPGVEAALVPRLFTPFSSGKENGKGLGLAITARIIAEQGGLIAYDVPPTGGARFSLYLPVG
ncbi:MAG: ATP-binding protein [Alphaproteobacteria bacterium]|nr:ATP-binding protein [Alphaproteobacteria bacterium]